MPATVTYEEQEHGLEQVLELEQEQGLEYKSTALKQQDKKQGTAIYQNAGEEKKSATHLRFSVALSFPPKN